MILRRFLVLYNLNSNSYNTCCGAIVGLLWKYIQHADADNDGHHNFLGSPETCQQKKQPNTLKQIFLAHRNEKKACCQNKIGERRSQATAGVTGKQDNMSRSPDNLNGNENSSVLEGNTPGRYGENLLGDDEEKQEDVLGSEGGGLDDSRTHPLLAGNEVTGTPGGHRKTRSLFATPTQRRRGRHHRHQSSIGQFLETIGEGVYGEARMVKKAWKTELNEGDSGRRFFLDMTMSRSLSVLPEDIPQFAEEAVGHRRRGSSLMIGVTPITEEEQELAPPPEPIAVTPVASVSSYAALLGAVFAVSSNGTALAKLHEVHPALKLFWRMTAVAAVLSVFAIKTMVKKKREEQAFFPKLSLSQWLTFGSAAVCFFLHTLLLFTALTLTSISNAVIFANSQSLLLVLGKLLR
jgi:hypothetical protein